MFMFMFMYEKVEAGRGIVSKTHISIVAVGFKINRVERFELMMSRVVASSVL